MYTDCTLTTITDFAPAPHPTATGNSTGDRTAPTGTGGPTFGQVLDDVETQPRATGEPRTRPKASRTPADRREVPERTDGRDPDETVAEGEAEGETTERAPAGLAAKTSRIPSTKASGSDRPADEGGALRAVTAESAASQPTGAEESGRPSGRRGGEAGAPAPVTAARAAGTGTSDPAGRDGTPVRGVEASTGDGGARRQATPARAAVREERTGSVRERSAGSSQPAPVAGAASGPTGGGQVDGAAAAREGRARRKRGSVHAGERSFAAASPDGERARAGEAAAGPAASAKTDRPVPRSPRTDATGTTTSAGERVAFQTAAETHPRTGTERSGRGGGRAARGREETAAEDVRRGGESGREAYPAAARGKAPAGEPSHSSPSPRPDGAGDPPVKTGGGEPQSADNGASLRVEAASASRSDTVAAGRGAAPTPSAVPADVLRQVSQRLGQQLRQGGSEVRFALQPARLGHLNLKIRTEHNRVTVHILADTPAAKEIIESHIGQLRADLSQQGLGLDAFDVDVSTAEDGPRQQPNRQAAGGGRPRGSAAGGARDGAPHEGDDRQPLHDEEGRRLVGVYA